MVLWIYAGAIAALIIDVSVLHREQKSVVDELITFAAVCLSTQFAYAATTNTISLSVMGLWAINTLFFSSAIFTVKLRKPKTSSLIPAVVYHAIATIIIFALYWLNLLSPVTVAFGIALLKFAFIALNQEWYLDTPRAFWYEDSWLYEVTCSSRFAPARVEVSSPQALFASSAKVPTCPAVPIPLVNMFSAAFSSRSSLHPH